MFDTITQYSRGNKAVKTGDVPRSLGTAASNTRPVQDSALPLADSTLRCSASHIHYNRGPATNFCNQQLVYTEPLLNTAVSCPISDALTNHSIPAITKINVQLRPK
jgi:hypothetical protein